VNLLQLPLLRMFSLTELRSLYSLLSCACRSVSGTDADTTLVVSKRTNIDASAWATANRVYTLPTDAQPGELVEVFASANAAASYCAILKTGSGQTCIFAGQTIAAASEITRLLIAGERMVFRYNGSNAWECVRDQRVRQECYLTGSTDNSLGSLTNATWIQQTYDTETYDVGSLHSTSSNTSRITVRRTGRYLLSAISSFAANNTGQRFCAWRLNGGTYMPPSSINATTTYNTRMSMSLILNLVAGDYVETQCFQNSGGPLTLDHAESSCAFSEILP
jgi:hypothetical protein